MAEMRSHTKTAGLKLCQKNISSELLASSHRKMRVLDCRPESKQVTEHVVDATGKDFEGFLQDVSKTFSVAEKETFVLTTTDRRVIDDHIFDELDDEITLQLLRTADQELPAATQEHISYVPHYYTLVQSGMYEYYASEGQKSLPYAFAELVDNSLSATANKEGLRNIDIRLLFDESQGKHAVVVRDNGCGMTSKQLNNWAVYRLSKFNRDNSTFHSDHSGYVRPAPVPRSLNSDISFFGVGGKQAVFYIGESARIITKPASSPDVHEFVMSKEDFERKEKNKEDIYCGVIRNRKPGDHAHIVAEEELYLQALIAEEEGKESFTAVVITGIQSDHITYLKQQFHLWTRELAHIYHYYVHGIHGNDVRQSSKNIERESDVDIQISLVEKSGKQPRLVNLRDIDNDMQTLYINSSSASFEFRAQAQGDAVVEGLIRYHPFLYDRETYPQDPYASPGAPDEEDDESLVLNPEGRGKRPVFECFWNGRLIPYTTVSEFEWCACSKKAGAVPAECYNRMSGVLFTNDCFPVSTNKLTFMDLELQLRDRETIFTRVINGQDQRVKIQREFTAWLKECHERYDKQIKFMGFQGVTSRLDVSTKKLQHPWARFSSIKWDGKMYKAGQHVKSVKTLPVLFGTIKEFLLYGDHEADVFATGGYVQIAMQPKELYDEVRTIPIFKIDRQATAASIKRNIEDELAKLPIELKIIWPEGNPWSDYASKPAGTPMGPIQVEILNKKGESISKLPVSSNGAGRRFLMELKVIWHSPKGDIQTNSHIGVHSAKWDYWFRKMENLNKLGKYTLHLQTILNENNSSVWAGKQLPSYTLNFTLTEGDAETFSVCGVSTPVQVGVPFSLSMELKDEFGHPARPPPDLKPKLECSTLEVTHEGTAVNGTTFTIKGVRARGSLKTKVHTLKIVLAGLRHDSQSVQMSMLPGLPHTLRVHPDEELITVENRTAVGFKVEVLDEAENITTHSKLIVCCQFVGVPEVPLEAVDCSNTGVGQLLGKALQLKNIRTQRLITAKFDLPNHQGVACVERKLCVLPSRSVSRAEVYRVETQGDAPMVIMNLERIDWTAGDTLGSLFYRLYDEGEREIPITSELSQKMKVNWSANMKSVDVAQGRLPPVCVPTLAQGEQFYQVAFKGQPSVETSFIIVPRPDEPECLKVILMETSVRLGETLAGNIILELTDQYGNKTEALTAESVKTIDVSADGLDKSSVAIKWQDSTKSVCVTGLRFISCAPGQREVRFAWQRYEEFVRVRVAPGPPAKIIIQDGPEMPLQVLNGHGVDTPFVLQLCDEWGNPAPDQRVVISVKGLSAQLKVKASVMSQPVDSEGKATFTLTQITAPKGEYKMEFRGTMNSSGIAGPSVLVNVMPDPCKPVKLAVEYDTGAFLFAGGNFPVFTVTIVSEDGGGVRNINPGSVSMLLWKAQATGQRPPPEASTLKCCKPKKTEKEECFYFRDKVIPERVGKYTIQFVLSVDKTKAIWSNQHILSVVPSTGVKLVPESPPATPVVSNNDVLANRTLLESLCLKIMDEYNNPAGEGCNGQVSVSLKSQSDCSQKDLPLFEGKTSSATFPLKDGEAHIKDLALAENSPGRDGTEYILIFQADILELTPFELPFRFYNDVENQRQMSALTKKKDRLSVSIEVYHSLFDTNNQLITELKGQLQVAESREKQLKSQIQKTGIGSALSTMSAIDALIRQKEAEMVSIKSQPRRSCSIPDPFRTSPDVLGKVAHLAKVDEDDAAKVISWHLLGDMDCVVTVTTAAARKIYGDTQGRQQVMPLETVFWKSSVRPLPHVRNGMNTFSPVGKPVFARDLLIFPQYADKCQMVFGSLLGDTILIDDLDSANHYRKGVVQSKIQCPTLLTRQGDRIRSNGKFGGLQNKAPPIEKLRGHVFGAPLPKEYYTASSHAEMLQQYRAALDKSQEVQADYDAHVQYLQSPEMRQKERELKEQTSQLQDIEQELASTPARTPLVSAVKRAHLEQGESSRAPSKRARLKPCRLLD
ncbi:structural maintenance of chromosomes flexible hinge domain-containing protein 1 isoform X2 [Clupea harengus]|uniref:Structural maintenance of chromosomes flexible hinge domain-containing protein 1 isoform X2 n=1 Tax=Clupea harengus TaxID=7950 RepID=A0A6P8GJR1_CLUHA|nr:structural maintenance of chromosomes flexible hinge domain-containing protein 1 isoform X2 [Clupea harengus]